jgi:EAL domain-containing protein (putative c-di-GMP-specific phosphodiesterase class I)
VTGAEALVRWQHPQRGLVPPVEFIRLAEESDLIFPLGAWILETACTQLAQWARNPALEHLSLAVNVSASQFQQIDFVQGVLDVLHRTGANPHRLKLELTESMLIDNVASITSKMATLKSHGVTFSLDDFGTGYSSLSYLKQLPLNELKIDRSFVRDALIDQNDAAIARMVIVLAETLGLTVLAEGVETDAQRALLLGQGCRNFQGYYFSRPVPIAQFEDYAQSHP